MDSVNNFAAHVAQLRTHECSQKEKILCFQHIAECVMSPALAAHINYSTHCTTAINVLLLFCEDLDTVVRMSAEENLNKIFRALEKTRVSRILMDLYGEIKRNGNQRSLRICLNLFSYYAPRIKEKHVMMYAQRLLPCMQTMAQRKETQLCETLCEFVKSFGRYLQLGLTDSETCKLFEFFMANIGGECPVKRRCSAQNCISLIENARNKSLMAKHGLNKVIALLLADQQSHTVLGALGLLRLLLPLIMRGFSDDCSDEDDGEEAPPGQMAFRRGKSHCHASTGMSTIAVAITTTECRQIVEIYDYCLHLLGTSNTSNHAVINAALEVINAILQALDGGGSGSTGGSGKAAAAKSLQLLLCNQQLQHNEYLRRRKSLKNQIFQLRNYEMATTTKTTSAAAEDGMLVSTSSATPPAMPSATAAQRRAAGSQAAEAAQGALAELSAGNMKIASASEQKLQPETEVGAARQTAYKLEMQKISNVELQREGRAAQLPASTWHAVGIRDAAAADDAAATHADEAGDAALRRNVADDVDNDDEAWQSKGKRQKPELQQRYRIAARSISECVVDDDAGNEADVDVAADDEEDEYDFTTLSEINEPQATTCALTTAIDVDNLIDAIDASDSRSASASTAPPKTAQTQTPELELPQQPQHLLTADDKSQFLSDIDNESFNSIDFEADLTIGGIASAPAAATAGASVEGAAVSSTSAVAAGSKTSSDTIGSFFNHLISHSNAASESVSKLFRQSSTSDVKATPTKAASTDKADAVSSTSNSLVDTRSLSSSVSNSKRLESDAAAEAPVLHARSQSSGSAATCTNDDTRSTSASITASTALLVDSNARNTAADCSSDEASSPQRRANPFLSESSPLRATVTGPPLLTLKIGSIYEQSMVYYTARFIAARFLLTGQAGGLHDDVAIRVSIKSLSLCVLAQCVRLAPQALQLPLEITEAELGQLQALAQLPVGVEQVKEAAQSASGSSSASGSPSQPRSDVSSSSNLGTDYEHLDAGGDVVDLAKHSLFFPGASASSDVLPEENMLLLEIKDDHFGKSTCDHLLNQPLSRSADPVLFAPARPSAFTMPTAQQPGLSKSEIIETQRSKAAHFRITQATEDVPPPMLPPRPPKRTKSMRKSVASATASIAAATQALQADRAATATLGEQQQQLADILLYYNHADPMLRGGVQQIIGNFIQASGAGLTLPLQLNLQHLLAMLLKGLQDEIHTVVIQALNAFDKVFSHVVYKYLTGPLCHYQQQQLQQQQHQWQQEEQQTAYKEASATTATAFGQYRQQQHEPEQQKHSPNDAQRPKQTCTDAGMSFAQPTAASSAVLDNDELIAALLNTFQLQTKCSNNSNNAAAAARPSAAGESAGDGTLFISPKLLLNKLRLCHHNKYWLVQNKYAEVISNLNYAVLRSYYGNGSNNISNNNGHCQHAANVAGDDVVCTYERIFLDELLQLIGDDDFRVREHAAACLCRFVIQNASQQQPQQQQHSKLATGTADGSTRPADETLEDGTSASAAMETYQTNSNLLWDFLEYRIFGGMSAPLRNLFRASASIAPPLTDEAADGSAGGGAGRAGSNRYAAFALRRHLAEEEKVLARVLYRMTNKLMELNDKNLQFGIIYTLKLLLKHFNFVDYRNAWTEFNFMEICMKYCYYNYATAADLNCQNDLIDVTGKLMAGAILSTSNPTKYHALLEQLLTHTLKLINIYYHLFSNQKPLLFAKAQKVDLFTNAKELAIVQCVGYFGSDYVYIKLYNTLRSANDSYKMTINQESGSILISLLKTCLTTLGLCIELRTHAVATVAATPTKSSSGSSSNIATDVVVPASAVLKLIEEILQYLTKLINYAPVECIACLRQLLKYLFAQNYGNRQQDYYGAFICPYFVARRRGQRSCSGSGGVQDETMCSAQTINSSATATVAATRRLSAATAAATTPTMSSSGGAAAHNGRNAMASPANYDGSSSAALDYRLFGELLVGALNFPNWKWEREAECARHIKLFEPLVIYCLTLFMKSNAIVQAPILEMLSQLLELNVTYSVLDAKNVIFNQIINSLELIENGMARNGRIIIPPMMNFLIQLTQRSDPKLITIPKIISIANNLLANNTIRGCALLALKTLAYEVFFMSAASSDPTLSAQAEQRAAFQSPITLSPTSTPQQQRRIAAEEAAIAAAAADALLAGSRELDTQKEVVLGMLEKFMDAAECQQVLGLLLLRERSASEMYVALEQGQGDGVSGAATVNVNILQSTLLQEPSALHAIVCRGMCERRIHVEAWSDFFVLDAFFRNNGKNVLADSKEFLALLQLFITQDVANFSDLSYATIILANVILRTEEIYLVNHIKLFLKNHPELEQKAVEAASVPQRPSGALTAPHGMSDGPSTSSAAAAAMAAVAAAAAGSAASGDCVVSEINYFAKVLCRKLEVCLACLNAAAPLGCDAQYCGVAVRFVAALCDVCCRSRHKAALQSVFRLVLAEAEFLSKYYEFLATSPSTLAMMSGCGAADEQAAALLLQLEVFKLLSAMKLLDPLVLLQQLQTVGGVKWNVRRTLLREVCQRNPNPMNWNLQQVRQLFDAAHLNALILEHFTFVCNLCEVDEEFCSLLQSALLRHATVLNKHAIRAILRLVLRLGSAAGSSIQCTARFLQLLSKLHQLHQLHAAHRPLQLQLERLARRLIAGSAHDSNAIYDSFLRSAEEAEEEFGSAGQLQFMLLNDLETLQTTKAKAAALEPRIIDEKWLFAQLIKFPTQPDYDPQQLTRILLEIQSEPKLHKIFGEGGGGGGGGGFVVARVLRHAIASSLRAMLAAFRNNCTQHNPHIHYMQPNPLARVACAVLMARTAAVAATVGDTNAAEVAQLEETGALHLCHAVIALMQSVRQIETTALVYIEARFVDKFLREHLLRPEHIVTLLGFLDWCCQGALRLLRVGQQQRQQRLSSIAVLLRCIEALLQQRLLWQELNQTEQAHLLTLPQRSRLLCRALQVLYVAVTQSIQQTIFYKRHKLQASHNNNNNNITMPKDDAACALLLQAQAPKAIFMAKFIEARMDIEVGGCGDARPSYIAGAGVASVVSGSGAAAGAAGGCVATGGGGLAGSAASALHGDFEGVNLEETLVPLSILNSIGISILRTNQFYAYAVTPFEIIQQQQQLEQLQLQQQQCIQREREQQEYGGVAAAAIVGSLAACESPIKRAATMTTSTTGKLPTIPLESLSDVDVLRKFVKRLSIFGFTTRQQFEEYFMTFLLLINKVYDENMVDEQEQFQIRSTCFEAILELLITYKTFPIVGNKLSYFHHTTRWARINCDSISLKKLHKVQLLVSSSNVFYQPNLERRLAAASPGAAADTEMEADNVIGTKHFLANQYDLNFVWQQMEAYTQPTSMQAADDTASASSRDGSVGASVTSSGGGEDVVTRNYRYFTAQSGVDFKSSAQLMFDVLTQMVECNYILVLPNLVKFCEICESRDQIKWIRDKALKLQESIPMDDTISHQHLIYLACKTQAMLIPTLGELQQLCALIANYLKSSHVFIRNATLGGVLCLLECCSKTNTTIGRLSEELALLRELIVGYINRHGIIDESSMQCSDTHTKLVWTLNYCLIEWTSKFVPQCHLLSNTIIAASNFLRKTTNEQLYLCVLHGLERIVVISNNRTSGSIGIGANNAAQDGGGIVTPLLRNKIEKLALDLVKLENEKFSIPALKLLLSCIYVGSAKQLENTELSNGIVQDDPEIIAQQTDKVDILLHCIKSSTRDAAWIYGQVLCQIIRDLVPPNEILTKVIKEFLAINQPHCDVIAMIVYQVFRSAIDSSFLQMLQDWLICSLATFLALPLPKGVWGLSVIFLSASINLHLIKLFPVLLSAGVGGAGDARKLGQHEIALFVTAAQDFYAKLSAEQKLRFRDAFEKFQQHRVYAQLLQSL